MNKKEQAIELSEELLSDIELKKYTLEQIMLKATRLARLIDDFDSIKYIQCELNGYNTKEVLDYDNYIKRSGRYYSDGINVNSLEFHNASIVEMESMIELQIIRLNQCSDKKDLSSKLIAEDILKTKKILSKITSSMYNYILSINYKLKYSEIVESIFNSRQKIVLDKLGIDPKYNDIINSISGNLQSSNQNDWSNAGNNCRRLLKQLADNIYPVDNNNLEKIIGTGKSQKTIKLGDEQYINRLKEYILLKLESETSEKIIGSNLDFIGSILDSVYEASNKGTHADFNKPEAERYVIYTYLLISDILEL